MNDKEYCTFMCSFWELYSVDTRNLIKQIFSSTVKCIRRCGSEWIIGTINLQSKSSSQVHSNVEYT